MALVTPAEAKIHIPELVGTLEDANLTTLIGRVGGAFARWCGYPPGSGPTTGLIPTMESAAYVRYLDGPGGRELALDIQPVVSVASIYDDSDWTWGADTLVAAGDYAISDAERGLVLLTATSTHGSWSVARRAIKATYTAGFATVPADLKWAAILAVRAVWTGRREQGKTNLSSDGLSVGLVDEAMLPATAREILAPFRLGRSLL